jgi:hypothetical protein
VLLALMVIAGVVGVGVYAYNVGVAQGLAASDKLVVPPAGAAPYPYWLSFYHRPFGFGLFGCLFPLLLGLLLIVLLRSILWRGPMGWKHMGYHGRWDKGVPPMVEEWHRKMHEPQSADK